MTKRRDTGATKKGDAKSSPKKRFDLVVDASVVLAEMLEDAESACDVDAFPWLIWLSSCGSEATRTLMWKAALGGPSGGDPVYGRHLWTAREALSDAAIWLADAKHSDFSQMACFRIETLLRLGISCCDRILSSQDALTIIDAVQKLQNAELEEDDLIQLIEEADARKKNPPNVADIGDKEIAAMFDRLSDEAKALADRLRNEMGEFDESDGFCTCGSDDPNCSCVKRIRKAKPAKPAKPAKKR